MIGGLVMDVVRSLTTRVPDDVTDVTDVTEATVD